MLIQVVSLFPEMFAGVFGNSMLWKAQEHGIVKFSVINLRNYGLGSRKTVDDSPYGGGDGMLLKPEPIFAAVEFAKQKAPSSKVLLMSPRGTDYNQEYARRLADTNQDLVIICGRYEGYDERITTLADEQICVGHYILTGGEIPAMTVVDTVVRLLPGVLGGEFSSEIESFSDGDNREYPQYTRPEEFNGLKVPDVLLSGNHAEIEKWRQEQSIHKKDN